MTNRQQSTLFWIIFLVLVAGLAFLIFPKYGRIAHQYLRSEARNIATNLTATSASNYTQRRLSSANGVTIKNCKDVLNIIGNVLPPNYEIISQDIEPDKVSICTLSGPAGKTQFSVIGAN